MPSGNRGPLTTALRVTPDRGAAPFRVALDGKPHAADIRLPVTAAEVASGTVSVALRGPVGGVSELFAGGIHEIAPAAEATLSVPLPVVTTTLKLTATADAPQWIHLATDRAACGGELRWELSGPLVRPLTVALTGRSGADVSPAMFTLSAPIGSVRVTVTGRMTAGKPGELELFAAPAADPRQVVGGGPVRVAVVGPAPVLVRTELVPTAGRGKPRPVVEGAVSAGTRQVEFTVRPVAPDLSDELLRGLEFDLVTTGPAGTDSGATAVGGTAVARVTFPGRAPLTGSDRAEAKAVFTPRGGVSSVQTAPVEFRVVREPLGVQVLVFGLGGGVAVAGAWLLFRSLRPPAK